MALEIKHAHVATGTEAGNGEVGKDEWNAALEATMATARILGRTTSGAGAVEELAAAAVWTLIASTATGTDQAWTGAQRATPTALTSGTTITPTLASGNDFTLTLGHNATLANPSDIASFIGQKGSIGGVQDGTGGRTLAFGNQWFPIGAATVPDVPDGANDKFRIDYHVVSATRIDFSLSSVGV